jgi:hypothetical protein
MEVSTVFTREQAIKAQALLDKAGYKTFRRAPSSKDQYIELIDKDDKVIAVIVDVQGLRDFGIRAY